MDGRLQVCSINRTPIKLREKLLKTNVEMLLGHELIGINENENCIDLKLHNLDNQEKVELVII